MKQAWKGTATTQLPQDSLRRMLQERKHPALRRIRRQMIMEAVAFCLLLAVYYDVFDGHRKPLYANLLLVASLLFAIAHSVAGYILARRRIGGDDLRQSLAHTLSAVRRFAFVTVTARVAMVACLLLFFTVTIKFSAGRYALLAGILGIFAVQGWLLIRMWRSRIQQLQASLRLLNDK